MTHTILLSAGTSGSRIAQLALREVHAHGDPDQVSAVFVAAESPDFFGLEMKPGVRWHLLPKMRDVLEAVTDDPAGYPWLDERAVDEIRKLSHGSGDGFGASPGAGRVAFTLVAAEVYNSLKSLHDAARARGDSVDVLQITAVMGGTSRGALTEAGLLARAACPKAVRRNLLVLPSFRADGNVRDHLRRCRNTLTALQIVEDGMTIRSRTFTGTHGRQTMEETLADEAYVVAPEYQTDTNALVMSLNEEEEILAAARIAAGLAGGDQAWQVLLNQTLDSTLDRVEAVRERMDDPDGRADAVLGGRVRWVSAVNEGRIICDQEALMEAIRDALLKKE